MRWMSRWWTGWPKASVGIVILGALSCSAFGQLKGSDIPGTIGLQAGTQAPPGIYVGNPAYFYTTENIKDKNGNSLPKSPRVNAFIDGIVVNWVTNYKIFGANVGGSLLLPFAQNRLVGDLLGSSNTGFGFSDTYLQPIGLGWHLHRADVNAGYGIYFPTGSFTPGASDNFARQKDRVFALGPEFNILWPKQRIQLTSRYFAEFGARDRTQGQGL